MVRYNHLSQNAISDQWEKIAQVYPYTNILCYYFKSFVNLASFLLTFKDQAGLNQGTQEDENHYKKETAWD